MSRTLVAYFSRAGENYFGGQLQTIPVGNTERVAKTVAEQTMGKLFRIEPVKAYPDEYGACTEAAKADLHANARPALKEMPENLGDYDFIFLGFPTWWGTMPMPVWTFLESYDFTGKYIYPFCTHEGSQMGHSEADIKRLCPKAEVLRGLPIRGNAVDNADAYVASWLRGLTVCPK